MAQVDKTVLVEYACDQMFSLVETFLFVCTKDRLSPKYTSRCMEYAVSSITSKPNRLALGQLSDQIGYSQKHFINLFKSQVGVSPKQYLKIMRFQQAVLEMETCRPIDWSDFAREHGYYDQSHLIHEFRYFSGFTPVEYMDRKTDMLNYVPVG